MSERTRYFEPQPETVAWLSSVCAPGEYRVLEPTEALPFLPSGLVAKSDKLIVACSGTAKGDVYFMANLHRADVRDNAIDHEPFGVCCSGDGTVSSGFLIHHGKWDGRTTDAPDLFFDTVNASGLGMMLPTSGSPPNSRGPLSELPVPGDGAAFATVLHRLHSQ